MNKTPTLKESFREVTELAGASPLLTNAILENIVAPENRPMSLWMQARRLALGAVLIAVLLIGLHGLTRLGMATCGSYLSEVPVGFVPAQFGAALKGFPSSLLVDPPSANVPTISMMHLLFLYLEATFQFAWTILGFGFLFGLASLHNSEQQLSLSLEVCS